MEEEQNDKDRVEEQRGRRGGREKDSIANKTTQL